MNEIELKFKINNYDYIYAYLYNLGCEFRPLIEQKDVVYYSNDNIDGNIDNGTIVIRTRISNDQKTITLKQRNIQKCACKEIEFNVENTSNVDDFIEMLGFTKKLEFVKKRYQTKYKNFNICLDEICNVGTYIEIEVLTADNNIDVYKEQILLFAQTIGVDINDIETRYYPQIILEEKDRRKKYDKKN